MEFGDFEPLSEDEIRAGVADLEEEYEVKTPSPAREGY